MMLSTTPAGFTLNLKLFPEAVDLELEAKTGGCS